MKFKNINCPICDSKKNYQIIFKKNFKASDLNTKIFSARRLPDKIHYQIVKCNKCGLVRSTPTADVKYLNKLYEKSLLTYDDEIKNLTTTYLNAIKPILKKLPKGAKILEVGCGNGFVLKSIYDLGYKNVYGIEPSIDATTKVNKKIKKKTPKELEITRKRQAKLAVLNKKIARSLNVSEIRYRRLFAFALPIVLFLEGRFRRSS